MLILTVDSSTDVGSVSLIKEERLIGEKLLNLEETHSQRLMPQLIDLMNCCGYSPDDLDGVGMTVGPGSFTGTRIGMATAKMLAQSLDLPVVGVSTLKVLAYSIKYVEGYICSLIDARGGRVFSCLYQAQEGFRAETEESLMEVSSLIKEVKNIDQKIYFVGEIVNKYQEEIASKIKEAEFVSDIFNLPRAGAVGELAIKELKEGKEDNLFALTPNYLKRSQAEIQWERKQQAREDGS